MVSWLIAVYYAPFLKMAMKTHATTLIADVSDDVFIFREENAITNEDNTVAVSMLE